MTLKRPKARFVENAVMTMLMDIGRPQETLGNKMEKLFDNIPVSVNLCEEEKFFMVGQKILVNDTDFGHQVMIVDSGASLTLGRLEWTKQYLGKFFRKS